MNKSGFTLIECMVALAMTIVVSLSASYMITSAKSGQMGHSTSMDCNQILRNIMEQISSIGYKKKYDKAYSSGKLIADALNGTEVKNHVLIKDDIMHALRTDTKIFTGQFVKGKDILNEAVPGRSNKFNVGSEDALEDVRIKFERQAWDLSQDKLYKDCETVDSSDKCKGACCPKPSSMCRTDNDKNKCTVCLEGKKLDKCSDSGKQDILGRSDLGYKIKASLKVCKRGKDCSSDAANNKTEMQCTLDRVFQYAPDVTGIAFKKDKPVELSSTAHNKPGVSCTSTNLSTGNTVSTDDTTSKSTDTTIPGYSCLFRHNKHNDRDVCGGAVPHASKEDFTSTFTVKKTQELNAAVFYCKIDHREFKADSNYIATPADGGSVYDLIEGDWEVCGKPSGNSTDNNVNKSVTSETSNEPGPAKMPDIEVNYKDDESFEIKFEYNTRKDVDYRVSVVAVDPAGNVSEIKKIDLASKNCALYRKNTQRTSCGKNQWCTLDKRNPWANVLGDRYKHRREHGTCRYYNVAVGNFALPSFDYDSNGCHKTNCKACGEKQLPTKDNKPHPIHGCCAPDPCTKKLSNEHFKADCGKPTGCTTCYCHWNTADEGTCGEE